MSLTQGLQSPRTPLRRFLDRELSAGTWPLRADYRRRLPTGPIVLPGEGVGFEAGAVGTAIDQRLRLAFTAARPVDTATALGVALCIGPDVGEAPGRVLGLRRRARRPRSPRAALAEVGHELIAALTRTVEELRLDKRGTPLRRTDDAEERLARMLLAAAWYAVQCRAPIAFGDTPLCQAAVEDPRGFDLERLLAVPHPDLVDDVLAQLERAAHSPLVKLRRANAARLCCAGPTFEGSADLSADADLVIGSTLVEIKSTRRVYDFPRPTMYQLLGYVLMDYSDQHAIDQVGLYLTRAGALVTWPIEDYLALLGARRRDLAELRSVFSQLLRYPDCRADDDPLPDQAGGVGRLLDDLAAVIADDCCPVCGNELQASVYRRRYCSIRCARRAPTLRRHGWL